MVESLNDEFMKAMFDVFNATTEKTGNVVFSSGQAAHDFAEVLSKISIGCDQHGRPSMPSLYLHPDTGARFLEELEGQPESFHLKIEEIKVEKEKEAIATEVERVSKFRW